MKTFKLLLFGGFSLTNPKGDAANISSKKVKALLAYLASQIGKPVSRESLATLLWEDSSEQQAKQSLRQALTHLRKAFNDDETVLQSNAENITLNSDAIWIDTNEFQRLQTSEKIRDRQKALDLVSGSYLEGFNPKAPAFDDWLMLQRSFFRDKTLNLLTEAAKIYVNTREFEKAIHATNQILLLDPLQESAHRRLMELYALTGKLSLALKQYRICRNSLQKELGVWPDRETESLYDKIEKQRYEAQTPIDEVQVSTSILHHNDDSHIQENLQGPELRLLTVLTVKLENYVELVANINIEELNEFLHEFSDYVSQQVSQQDGELYCVLGETYICTFGGKRVRGNDMERALLAAREIQQNLTSISKISIHIKQGIDCGKVLVGQATPNSPAPLLGDAVNCSRQMADVAPEDGIVISAKINNALAPIIVSERLKENIPFNQVLQAAYQVKDLIPQSARQQEFIGRTFEVRQLNAAIESCLEESIGQAFLIRGVAGIGKTSLVNKLQQSALEHHFIVCKGLELDFGVEAGQNAVQMIVRDLLAAGSELQDLEKSEIDTMVKLGRIPSEGLEYLLDLLDVPQPNEMAQQYELLNHQERLLGKQQYLARLVEKLALEQPLLIVAEDVHWSTSEDLQLLAHLSACVVDIPVIVIMTSRIENEPLDPAWRRAMQGTRLTTLDLSPMREQQAMELAKAQSDKAEQELQNIVSVAEGNPLFLKQLLLISWKISDSVPESVQSIAYSYLDYLQASDKEAIIAAAVLGQKFTLESVRYLIENEQYDISNLLAKRLIKQEPNYYLFSHALIRDGIYQSLLDSQRITLHRRAAKWYEQRDVVLFAQHLGKSNAENVVNAYVQAIQKLVSEYQFEQAINLTDELLSLNSENADLCECHFRKAECEQELGRVESSIESYQKVLENAEEDNGTIKALSGMAKSHAIQSEYDEALKLLDKALAIANKNENLNELAKLHQQKGNIYFSKSQQDLCEQEHGKSLSYAKQLGDPELEAQALSGLGDTYYLQGKIVSAYRSFSECVKICSQQKIMRILVPNIAMQGLTQLYNLNLNDALEQSEKAVKLAKQINNQYLIVLCLDILGNVQLEFADWDGVKRTAHEGLTIVKDLGAKNLEIDLLTNLAVAFANTGERQTARDYFTQAYELTDEIDLQFVGPTLLAFRAIYAEENEMQEHYLNNAYEMLQGNAYSHNYFNYYRMAMEHALIREKWEKVDEIINEFSTFTLQEPVGWANYFIERAKLIKNVQEDVNNMQAHQELEKLREFTLQIQFRSALSLIDTCLKNEK